MKSLGVDRFPLFNHRTLIEGIHLGGENILFCDYEIQSLRKTVLIMRFLMYLFVVLTSVCASSFLQEASLDTDSLSTENIISGSTIDASDPNNADQPDCSRTSFLNVNPDDSQAMSVFRRHSNACAANNPRGRFSSALENARELWRKIKGPTIQCPDPERDKVVTGAGPEVFETSPEDLAFVLNCVPGKPRSHQICNVKLIVEGIKHVIRRRGPWGQIEDPFLAQYCCETFRNTVSLIFSSHSG